MVKLHRYDSPISIGDVEIYGAHWSDYDKGDLMTTGKDSRIVSSDLQ
jgi:hypothetical protein